MGHGWRAAQTGGTHARALCQVPVHGRRPRDRPKGRRRTAADLPVDAGLQGIFGHDGQRRDPVVQRVGLGRERRGGECGCRGVGRDGPRRRARARGDSLRRDHAQHHARREREGGRRRLTLDAAGAKHRDRSPFAPVAVLDVVARVACVPRRNRVTPLGELVADPARGLVYGNRGCLHDDAGRIRRRWATRRWIACRLRFRGWHRSPLLQPGRFTELFFLDEATALAAGHRPCALCRRKDYDDLVELWRELHPGQVGADAIDGQLETERRDPATRDRLLHDVDLDVLPDGAFVLRDGAPWLVRGAELRRWTPAGYTSREPRPGGSTRSITPPSLVALLRTVRSPLVPFLHPSAGA